MTSVFKDLCEREIDLGAGARSRFFSLPAAGVGRLWQDFQVAGLAPYVLELLVRNCDGQQILERQVRELAGWQPQAARTGEIPFKVGRIVLNCAAGIPLLGDLTAIRARSAGLVTWPAASDRRCRSTWCSITL